MDLAHLPTTRHRLERGVAAVAIAGAVALAAGPGRWPFNGRVPGGDASVWQFLLADRLTLGFVRLSVVLLSLFVIASVPALLTAGRWLRGFGVTGLAADDALLPELQREVARLRDQLAQLALERDEALRLAQRQGDNDTTSTTGQPA